MKRISSTASHPILAAFLVTGVLAATPDGPPITRARALLYTEPSQALDVIEQAARATPEDPRVWSEYVRELGAVGFDALADQAARHALQLHPHDPDLLIARARLLGDGAALDVLAQLADVPGQRPLAQRLSEWVSLSLGIPDPAYPLFDRPTPDFYARWSDRLIILGRLDRADAVIHEGLAAAPADTPLLARKAILLALRDHIDEALAVQRAAGFPQLRLEGSWFGLPDILLAKARPNLAVAAFGDKPPADAPFRRLLARAISLAGDAPSARRLLDKNNFEDRLILLRVLTDDHDTDAATKLGAAIVTPMRIRQGSYAGPWLAHYDGPKSLSEDYLQACRWLLQHFPENRAGIEFDLGTGTESVNQYRAGWSPVRPASDEIRDLLATLNAPATRPASRPDHTSPNQKAITRRRLSDGLAKLARPGQAASVLEPLVLAAPAGDDSDAARWAILRRQAVSDRLAATDFWRVVDARPLLAAPAARHWNFARSGGKPWPSDIEVSAALAHVGPAVLADVLRRLEPNTISGTDRRPWITVVREIGSEQDTPALIATMQLLTEHQAANPMPAQDENDRLSFDALDEALRHLTGQISTGPDRASRTAFWTRWWLAQRSRIVAAARAP